MLTRLVFANVGYSLIGQEAVLIEIPIVVAADLCHLVWMRATAVAEGVQFPKSDNCGNFYDAVRSPDRRRIVD